MMQNFFGETDHSSYVLSESSLVNKIESWYKSFFFSESEYTSYDESKMSGNKDNTERCRESDNASVLFFLINQLSFLKSIIKT